MRKPMADDLNVYELDTDALIAALRERLEADTGEVIEQAPAGIWWVRSAGDRTATAATIGKALTQATDRFLREVKQDGS